MDTIKVLESIKESAAKFDFKKYAVQKALPDENSEEVEALVSEVCNLFEIDSVSGMVAMQEIIVENYTKIRNLEKVDYIEVIGAILECAKIHSNNGYIKDSCANLQNLNSENIIHFISTMKKSEWLNNGKVVSKEVFTNWFVYGEKPRGISSTEVSNLINKRAKAEEIKIIAYENALVALTSVSSVKDVENIVAEFLMAHSEYASEMIEINESLKTKNYTMILTDGESVEFFGSLTSEMVNHQEIYYTDHETEIEEYTFIAEECESYAQNIKTYGFLKTLKNKQIVEQILDLIPEYPEQDKAQAAEKIYAILNQELYGDDLYWAIADILFPNGDNEYYETIKSIVRTALEDGIVKAIKENQLLEVVFDAVLEDYPEQDRDKAIQDLYSIIEGEKQDGEIYPVIMEIVVPNSLRAEHIDKVAEYICEKASITLQQGKTAMHAVVEEYYLKLLSGEQVDFAAMAQDVVEVIENYTENEAIYNSIQAIKSESIAQAVESLKIVEQLFDTHLSNYPEDVKQQAIDTIYSIINGEKSGEDLYLAITEVLTPKEDDYYIDYATNMICWLATIDTYDGECVVRNIISTYYNT